MLNVLLGLSVLFTFAPKAVGNVKNRGPELTLPLSA